MALLMARDWYAKFHDQHNIRDNGLHENSRKYQIFSSEISHFSVQKSAALLGLGYNSVVSVDTDSKFKMNLFALNAALTKSIKQGNIPIAVVATAGTTDFGSIDPLEEIAIICKKYNIWFHVDAAYGCGLLSSKLQCIFC